MPERELQQLVADLCALLSIKHFHVRHPTGMTPGWPDSTIIGSRVLFRELKTQAGRVTSDQQAIGDMLKAAGQDWQVWRTSHWLSGEIERQLRQLCPPPMLDFPESHRYGT
jgi:hypothetical protein